MKKRYHKGSLIACGTASTASIFLLLLFLFFLRWLLFHSRSALEDKLLLPGHVLLLRSLLLEAAAALHLPKLADEASLCYLVNHVAQIAPHKPPTRILVAAHSAE